MSAANPSPPPEGTPAPPSTPSSNATPNATPAGGPALSAARLRIDRGASGRSGRRSLPWGWIGMGVLGVAAAAWWALAPKPLAVQTGSVVTSTPSQQYVELTASGYVVAQRRAAVSSKATGRLVELNVREGSRVRRGDVIARLDASDVQAAMAAAQAGVSQAQVGVSQARVELVNARAELKRNKDLQAQGFVSPQAVDAAQRRYDAAQASVQLAQAAVKSAQAQVKVQQVNQDFAEIRAPFNGVVLVKNANVGDIITPFSNAAGSQGAVVTMADMDTLEVEADVSEGSLAKVRVGQPVEIVLDALPDARFRGQVGGIVPTVDRAKATVMTKIRFEQIDARVLPEMSAKVSFLARPISAADQQPVLAVSPQAVQDQGGAKVVWRVQVDAAGASSAADQAPRWTAQPVRVQVGRTLGDVVEISPAAGQALKSGDKVVLSPPAKIQAGALITQAKP